jgi:uncharacterized protein YjbI with pentapeptide repeats
MDGTFSDGLVYITGRDSWGRPIELHWRDAKHLVIRAPLDNPAARKTRWKDISITYEPVPLAILHRRTAAVLLTVPTLWRADLRGARLMGADLTCQELIETDLERADLRYAMLYKADLSGADLRGADLEGAELEQASVFAADLRGANLRGANLMITIYNRDTKWPTGFDPKTRGATFVDY